MKRNLENNSGHTEVPVTLDVENVELPAQQQSGDGQPPAARQIMPELSNRIPANHPIDEVQADTLEESLASHSTDFSPHDTANSDQSIRLTSRVDMQKNPVEPQSMATPIAVENSIAYLISAAQSGNASAQFQLGEMYYHGMGIEQDLSIAAYWFSQAAEQGHADAQYILGGMYENGEGVEEDLSIAAELYGQAAEQGHADAQDFLAYFHTEGWGVEVDIAKTIYWYGLAAAQGHANAQYSLGYKYATGEGVEQNLETAASLYLSAAKQGDTNALSAMVEIYTKGLGVEQDLERAAYWYLKHKISENENNTEVIHLGNSKHIEFIPDLLNKVPDFKDVKKLTFTLLSNDAVMIGKISSLIRSDTRIENLEIHTFNLTKKRAQLIVDSLESNTHLTTLLIVDEKSNESLNEQIAQALAINDLRQYLKKYQPVRSDQLPLEVLIPLADQLIISSIKVEDKTKEECKAALNEFLLSVQFNTMEANAQQSG